MMNLSAIDDRKANAQKGMDTEEGIDTSLIIH